MPEKLCKVIAHHILLFFNITDPLNKSKIFPVFYFIQTLGHVQNVIKCSPKNVIIGIMSRMSSVINDPIFRDQKASNL
ncbi:hypothetical protein BpHYR1_005683 [Brachionus plicatilis]|uniref:Uncharacterized protein n=1 Tax=Brachionus plicatilis TaxID=10195 RepID=A0A3M7QTB0_BRAPC|nr:hypothetical protein BpHYR1_005683 [Brachionus plicatilis]